MKKSSIDSPSRKLSTRRGATCSERPVIRSDKSAFVPRPVGGCQELRDIGRGKGARAHLAQDVLLAELHQADLAFLQELDHASHATLQAIQLPLDVLELVQHSLSGRLALRSARAPPL